MNKETEFEVIIIGGSYSGLAAGMALGRALRKVLIIDSGKPCNASTPYSHNFLTNDGRKPNEIAQIAKQQVQKYDTISFLSGYVVSGKKQGNNFQLTVQTGETFKSSKLVFATGIVDVKPDIPGFAECWGISVLHCPYCHGYEVRHQKTGILAKGEMAFELSSLIYNWTSDITLYTNGVSNISEQHKKKLLSRNINIDERNIEHFEHKDGFIEKIIFKDGANINVKTIYAPLPFNQHSNVPQTMGCELSEDGYIKVDTTQRTTVPGIFACGDNTTRMRTVANAVAMGTATGMIVNKELIAETF